MANELTKDEQEFAFEIDGESTSHSVDLIADQDQNINIEELTEDENYEKFQSSIPPGSRVINIIVENGITVEKTYLTPSGEKLLILL